MSITGKKEEKKRTRLVVDSDNGRHFMWMKNTLSSPKRNLAMSRRDLEYDWSIKTTSLDRHLLMCISTFCSMN